jgi:hypothetical protein
MAKVRCRRLPIAKPSLPAAPIPEVPFGSPRLGTGLSLDSRNRRGFFRVAKRGQKRGLLQMGRSDEYRRFAAECLKINQAAEDEQQRAVFLQMARLWLALAQKDDTNANRKQGPEDAIK